MASDIGLRTTQTKPAAATWATLCSFVFCKLLFGILIHIVQSGDVGDSHVRRLLLSDMGD